jgi:hypothetical protein
MKHYTKKEMFVIEVSWYVMAFGRKLMKLGLNKIGSSIISIGLKIK